MGTWTTTKGRFDILNRYLSGAGGAADLVLILVDTPPASQATTEDLNFVSEVVADELAGTGYTRISLANEAATENDTTNLGAIDADDPSAQTLAADNGTIAGAWLARNTGSDATSPLIVFLDSTDLVTNGGNVQPQVNAAGLLTAA